MPSRAGLTDNVSACIIDGLGGVGKTEVAKSFVRANQHQFDAIIFLVADHRLRLLEQCAQVASYLGLIDTPLDTNCNDGRDKLMMWLSSPVKKLGFPAENPDRLNGVPEDRAKWLIIFDNADDPNILFDFWPLSGFGSILITSRNPNLRTEYFNSAKGWTLEGLPMQDAMSLLKRLTLSDQKSEEVDAAARTIVQSLEGLPLAVHQIGWIIKRRRLSLNTFVKKYARNANLYALFEVRRITRGYGDNLGSVWAFDTLEMEDKAALKVLNCLALLDPTCVQDEITSNIIQNNVIDGVSMTTYEYDCVLTRLIECSMVQINRKDTSLHLHRLVQAVARTRMSASVSVFEDIFVLVSNSVAESWAYRSGKTNTRGLISRWQHCCAVYPHIVHLGHVARELLEVQETMYISIIFVDLLCEAAWYDFQNRT